MTRLLILFLLGLPQFALAAVPEQVLAIAGTYYGEAFNGNDLDPVVTVMAFDDQGRFYGNYQVEDEFALFEGSLSSLVQEGERTFTMEWTDKDGEGFVFMQFNADYSAFSGFWTDTSGEAQRPWNGRKQ